MGWALATMLSRDGKRLVFSGGSGEKKVGEGAA